MHTFVVAELGLSHDGSRDNWRRLIEVALEAGADGIKGQYWSTPEAMGWHRAGQLPLWKKYFTPLDWLEDIPAEKRMCTVYIPEDIPAILPHVIRFKVGSWESSRGQLVDEYLALNDPRPILVSVGGWSQAQLNRRRRDAKLHYLHCVAEYPTPLTHLNLRMIRGMHGFSDHTGDWETGERAVLAGARIIEAHLRLHETPKENPDFAVALLPEDFRSYVHWVREAETWM